MNIKKLSKGLCFISDTFNLVGNYLQLVIVNKAVVVGGIKSYLISFTKRKIVKASFIDNLIAGLRAFNHGFDVVEVHLEEDLGITNALSIMFNGKEVAYFNVLSYKPSVYYDYDDNYVDNLKKVRILITKMKNLRIKNFHIKNLRIKNFHIKNLRIKKLHMKKRKEMTRNMVLQVKPKCSMDIS